MIYDIVIAGGGISGCMAAIAASRLGAKTLLIDKHGFLGGTLTACGTGPMMSFHAGKKQVVRGITDEIVQNLVRKNLSTGHIFDTTGCTDSVTPFSAEGLKRELETVILESGGEVLYHTTIYQTNCDASGIKSIKVCHSGGTDEIASKIFIDASGDGQLSFLAGAPTRLGRESDGKCQPVTLNIRMNGIDIPKLRAYIKSSAEDFPEQAVDTTRIDKAPRLSVGGFDKIYDEATANNELNIPRKGVLFFETDVPGEIIINTTRVTNIDPTNPHDLTKAEIEARRQASDLVRVLTSRAPGFENAKLMYTGPAIGIRQSRQIVGKHILTGEELLSCKRFEDVIAHGGYPVDIHSPDDEKVFAKRLKPGEYYDIPYCTMINEIPNLITVGRCISADFEAQSALRVSPIAGAIGHAGGVAAAICVKNSCIAADVPIKEVQSLLKQQGAFLRI